MGQDDNDSGLYEIPQWVIKWLAYGTILCFDAFLIVFILSNYLTNVKWGDIGDMSGWASTLVSIGGFVMLFHQLRQNNEDSKQAETRHAKTLKRQQQHFDLNTQVALFDKRYEVSQAIQNFPKFAATEKQLSNTHLDEKIHLFIRAVYLFPDINDLDEPVLKLLEQGQALIDQRDFMLTSTEVSEQKECSERIDGILVEIAAICSGITRSFDKYLMMPTMSTDPDSQ